MSVNRTELIAAIAEKAGLTKTDGPDLELVDQIAGMAEVPLVVEGRVHTPAQAAAAMEHGAFAVVVGTAITHPTTITSWFARALPGALWKG